MTFLRALVIPTAEKVPAHLFRRLALRLGHRQEDEHGRAHRQGREEEVKAWKKMDSKSAYDSYLGKYRKSSQRVKVPE